MKKVLALLLALACALPLGVAAAAATGDAIPYPNIGLVVESDLCDGDGAISGLENWEEYCKNA